MPLIETMIVNSRTDRMARNSDSTKYALIGAKAIHYELRALGVKNLPSARAIHKILVRNHLIEKNRPNLIPIHEPHCKHYPEPEASYINDLQQLDLIGPRYIEGDSTKYYLVTLKDTVSKRINLEPLIGHQAQDISRFLISSWKTMGLPKVLQMDNGLEFRGSNRYPRRFGQVVRLCLDIGVIPVYIPPREPWRNAFIENFNGLTNRLFLGKQRFSNYQSMRTEAQDFVHFCNHRHRHETLKGLSTMEFRFGNGKEVRSLDTDYHEDPSKLPLDKGQIWIIRMVRKSGRITTFADDKFMINPELKWHYVKLVIDVKEQLMYVYHEDQLIKTINYPLEL